MSVYKKIFLLLLLIIISFLLSSCLSGNVPVTPNTDTGTTGDNNGFEKEDEEESSENSQENQDNPSSDENINQDSSEDNKQDESDDNTSVPENNTNQESSDENGEDNTELLKTYTVRFEVAKDEFFLKTTSDKIEAFDPPKLENYDFLGWYLADSVWNFEDSVVCDITVHAKWQAHEYTIEYFLDGGENNKDNSSSFSIDKPFIQLKPPSKDGAYFMGWFSDAEYTVPFEFDGVLKDLNVYAKFISESEGLEYEKRGDAYFVTSYSGTDSFVVIPSKHNGLAVVGISSSAFCSESILDVMLPNSICYIERNAFSACNNLRYSYYEGGFYLGNKSNEYLALVSVENSEAEMLKLHNDTKIIADFACSDMLFLTNIEGLLNPYYIGKSSFENCGMLANTDVFSNAVEIQDSAFSSCIEIESICFLSLRQMGDGAFSYCTKLKNISLSDSLKAIPEEAFMSCRRIEALVIGKEVSCFGKNAFHQTNDTMKIFYRAEKYKWDNIDFSDNFIISSLDVYYYSDTAPTKDENYWCYEDNAIKIW